MPRELLLDARELEPPEPFEQATSLLREMEPGQYLRMLHRRVPYPLFDFCQGMSLQYRLVQEGHESYDIIIYFPVDEYSLRQVNLL